MNEPKLIIEEVTDPVRITHPFHPFRGQQFLCVGERNTRAGKRLLLKFSETAVRAIPPQWTDLACPDLEVALGEGRALFRVVEDDPRVARDPARDPIHRA